MRSCGPPWGWEVQRNALRSGGHTIQPGATGRLRRRRTCTMLGWFMALDMAASMMAMRSCFSAPLILAGRIMVLMATVVPRHSPARGEERAPGAVGRPPASRPVASAPPPPARSPSPTHRIALHYMTS